MAAYIKPTFHSSFIQYWYSQNWNAERWEQELTMLRNIGINEIILASIVDTKSKYAVYFSDINGFTHCSTDMVETALTAACKLGMKVRIGIGFSDDWWKKYKSSSWLSEEASINDAIIKEVACKYGAYKSFSGWYIPYEFAQTTIQTEGQQTNISRFFKSMTSEIKYRLPKDIMIAPFYNNTLQGSKPLNSWTTALQNVLKDTGIDILALQDSVGTNYNKLEQLPDIFYYTKKACEALGIKFYVDVETFTMTSSGFESAPQSRINKQLSIAEIYAEGYAAFSIDHYQNRIEPSQVQYYDGYYNYYISRFHR